MNERDIAITNDNRLMEMSVYWETKGNMVNPDPGKVLERFTEFKGLVKRGSYTIEQLGKKVFSTYGLMTTAGANLDNLPEIIKVLQQLEKHDSKKKSDEKK